MPGKSLHPDGGGGQRNARRRKSETRSAFASRHPPDPRRGVRFNNAQNTNRNHAMIISVLNRRTENATTQCREKSGVARHANPARDAFFRQTPGAFAIPNLLVALVVIGAAAVAYWQFASRGKAEAELLKLRQESQEVQKLRTENQELQRLRNQSQELERLRNETKELLKLRNEVRQLRAEKDQSQKVLAENQQLRNSIQQLQQVGTENQQLRGQMQQLQANQQMAQRYGLVPANAVDAQTGACINNLRILTGAKDQWALENKKGVGTAVNPKDIVPYIKGNLLPTCPAGGVYTINAVGANSTCSIPNHKF